MLPRVPPFLFMALGKVTAAGIAARVSAVED